MLNLLRDNFATYQGHTQITNLYGYAQMILNSHHIKKLINLFIYRASSFELLLYNKVITFQSFGK